MVGHGRCSHRARGGGAAAGGCETVIVVAGGRPVAWAGERVDEWELGQDHRFTKDGFKGEVKTTHRSAQPHHQIADTTAFAKSSSQTLRWIKPPRKQTACAGDVFDVNSGDLKGLLWAAKNGHETVVWLLAEKGADIVASEPGYHTLW